MSTMPRIFVVCTFGLRQAPLLASFVRHYQSLGVENFKLTFQIDPDEANDRKTAAALAASASTLSSLGLEHAEILVGKFDAALLRTHHDAIQARLHPSDWIVWADSDEFQAYPTGINAFIDQIASEGDVDAVSGELVDRVTRDGSLPILDPDGLIWQQFPIGCDLTGRILDAFTHKICLAKASVAVTPGAHQVARRHGIRGRLSHHIIPVHHFKWDATVLERLGRRLRTDWKRRCHWWTESQRFIDYFNEHGCLCLENLDTFDFGCDARIEDNWRSRRFVTGLRSRNRAFALSLEKAA